MKHKRIFIIIMILVILIIITIVGLLVLLRNSTGLKNQYRVDVPELTEEESGAILITTLQKVSKP